MNRTVARSGLGLISLALLLVTFLAAPLLGDRLPHRLATHWGLDGTANGSSSLSGLLLFGLLLVVPAVLVVLAVAVSSRPRAAGVKPMLAGVATLIGTIGAASVLMTVLANRNVTDWTTVRGPGAVSFLVLFAVAVGAAALAARLAVALPSMRFEPVAGVALDVPASATVSWTRSLSARWVVWMSAVMVAGGALLVAFVSQRWAGLVLVLAGLLTSVLAHIDVAADRRGLTVRFGPFGWPRVRVPVDRIATASAIDVTPAQWGGWGYRGSLRIFRRAAVVLRGGPGLRVDLHDGRVFVVTIDDPATAAAVLTREIALTGPVKAG